MWTVIVVVVALVVYLRRGRKRGEGGEGEVGRREKGRVEVWKVWEGVGGGVAGIFDGDLAEVWEI